MQKLVLLGVCLLAALAFAAPPLEQEVFSADYMISAGDGGAEVAGDDGVEVVDGAEGVATARSCNNAQCHRLCVAIGWRRGFCVSASTCRCTR
ncbi:hypothetical protein EVAR_50482_1 [Eumeta japonica]|uniref:Invertebrate defensins family profile domain-containing protein n=1 Tax=Eumeta variegata TaxID=151549 RepID=A0A4C1XWQ2_EUMVA|nr:hypothetical protein EVAR_50482_1 [Eumeta japonica]